MTVPGDAIHGCRWSALFPTGSALIAEDDERFGVFLQRLLIETLLHCSKCERDDAGAHAATSVPMAPPPSVPVVAEREQIKTTANMSRTVGLSVL